MNYYCAKVDTAVKNIVGIIVKCDCPVDARKDMIGILHHQFGLSSRVGQVSECFSPDPIVDFPVVGAEGWAWWMTAG